MDELDLSGMLDFEPSGPEVRLDRMVKPFEDAKLRGARFNCVSLEAWLGVVEEAGIDCVPADVVARLPVEVLLNFEEPTDADKHHWDRLAELNSSVHAGTMLRWDCCASLDLKLAMDKNPSALSPEDRGGLHPADPRFFDILYEFPEVEMRVLQRPWVLARMDQQRPVEYRVFVHDGEVVGVSNYYPQRDLPADSSVLSEIRDAVVASQKIINHLEELKLLPFSLRAGSELFDDEKPSCTLDFIVDETSKLLFLEAGPPFGAGAHPCCFEKNVNDAGQIVVEGVALALGQAPLQLDEVLRIRRPAP